MKEHVLSSFYIFLIISIQWAISADTPFFEQLTVDDGLAQNGVECILQDRQGYLWFGTRGGLSRYDGYDFLNYVHNPVDSHSISSNSVFALFETARYLWVGTVGKLNLLDKSTNRFTSLPIYAVSSITRDAQGTIWLGSLTHGLYAIDSTARHWRHYTPNNSAIADCTITALLADLQGFLWIGTQYSGLYRLDTRQSNLTPRTFRHIPGDSHSLSSDFITSMCRDEHDNFWIGTRDRGLNYMTRDGKVVRFRHLSNKKNTLSEDEIRSLYYEPKTQTLWIGHYNKGITRMRITAHQEFIFTHYDARFFQSGHLDRDCVKTIYQDFSGLLWLGTHGSGIYKMIPSAIKFHTVRHQAKQSDARFHNQVWAFYAPNKDSVWIGTSRGLTLYTGSNALEDHPLIPRHNRKFDFEIRSVLPAGPGCLWLAFLGKGLYQYHYPERRLIPFPWEKPILPMHETNLYALYDDGQKYLWIASNGGGLVKFDKIRKTFTSYNIRYSKNSDPLSHGWVITIAPDATGNLWLGTWKNGLIKFNPRNGRLRHFVSDSKNSAGLNNNTVFCLHFSKADPHILWLGTYGGGLNRMDTTSGTFQHYTIKNGLPDNVIYGLVEDRFNRLWLSTNKGLSCFDPQREFFKTYTIKDGLPSNEFNLGACYQNEQGRIFFGTSNGFVYFDPEYELNSVPPRLRLTAFKKYNQIVAFPESLNRLKEISISSRDKVISFEFTALHFKNSAQNQYAYKLEGFDTDWNYCGTRRQAVYTHLPAGDYIFRVKAANCDGFWNETGLSIPLHILPPFWLKTEFLIISALLLLLLLFTGYRMHIKRLIAIEKAKLEEGERLRRKMAADFHDELGHRVTKISLLSKIALKEIAGNGRPIKSFLHQISENADGLFSEMKELVWELDPQKDSLYNLLSQLKSFSSQLFDTTDIAFQIEGLTPHLENMKLSMEWRQNLLRIFKEGMTNILRHAADCKNVRLRVVCEEETLQLSLTDDGPGFDIRTSSEGNGLRNMRQRAQKINGTLRIESNPGQGTKIIFTAKLP